MIRHRHRQPGPRGLDRPLREADGRRRPAGPGWSTRAAVAGVALVLALLSIMASTTGTAGAASYVQIEGEGSSWSANALDQWIQDVQPQGIRVDFTANGSTAGREDFIIGKTDFAASDIPFQTNPTDGFSAPEFPKAGSYAYMPITAGGTVFMYNLTINGQRVTDLRLSGENLAKIFTGEITNWDDPALAADNPALSLPNETIVPVVRSDGAGSSYEISEWMISQYPTIWNAYCQRVGRAPHCGPTSFWPTVSGMIAQPGDSNVAGYVSASYAAGSIGYTEYSYALNTGFPVAKMLNSAGYYTEPTAQNVAVSLLDAQVDTTDVNNPALYLTENLTGVYTDNDPRTYPLSSYSYLILPTGTTGNAFSTDKGYTLGAFADYAICGGQQEAAGLGYSPLPINLVEAGFAQIDKIPGANTAAVNIQSCHNPTFSSTGANELAVTAPYPAACDKQGPTQCTSGTGGAAKTATVVTPGSAEAKSGASTSTTAAGSSSTGSTTSGGKGGADGGSTASTVEHCDPTTGVCTTGSGSGTDAAGGNPTALPATLAVTHGWSVDQWLLVVIGLVLLAIVLVPGVSAARSRSRRG